MKTILTKILDIFKTKTNNQGKDKYGFIKVDAYISSKDDGYFITPEGEEIYFRSEREYQKLNREFHALLDKTKTPY